MVPGRLYFSLFLPALRDHMAALLAVGTFLGVSLHCIDGRSWGSLRGRGRLLSSDRLLGIGQPIPDRGRVDRILVVLDRIHDQDVFRSDLRQQDRNVRLVANRTWRNGIQSMYEQPYPIHKVPCVGATVARRLAQLGKQLAECGELHPPVPLFEFIPEVTRRFESRDMNADVGGQVPEDGVVAVPFGPPTPLPAVGAPRITVTHASPSLFDHSPTTSYLNHPI